MSWSLGSEGLIWSLLNCRILSLVDTYFGVILLTFAYENRVCINLRLAERNMPSTSFKGFDSVCLAGMRVFRGFTERIFQIITQQATRILNVMCDAERVNILIIDMGDTRSFGVRTRILSGRSVE